MIGGWFVTGTGTGVGKTQVAEALLCALVASGRRAVGMKPVASGCRQTAAGLRSDDAERLQAASAFMADYRDVNPYAFLPPIAPHVAAERIGVTMQAQVVQQHFERLAAAADWLVVEGVGGWRVPFDSTLYMSDIARVIGLPVVLVVGVRLGCINHALLTAGAIRGDGCAFAGWVANQLDPMFDSGGETITALSHYLGTPPLTIVGHQPAGTKWRTEGVAMVSQLLG
ncbi:MAG: dethiobiotin synthase [Gammaproteobacteria bacterium]|nr:dethiobiotin synthase [Gammaproteobacteria bacterium]